MQTSSDKVNAVIQLDDLIDKTIAKSASYRQAILDLRNELDQLRKEMQEENERRNIREEEMQRKILLLECEVQNDQIYISALIGQLQEAHIPPVKREELNLDDCSKVSKKKTKKGDGYVG